MFSFLGGSTTLIAARQDPTQERPAPPYPTPISFPSIDYLPEVPQAWSKESAPDLFQPYSRIRKPGDVSAEHLAILNASLQPNIESNIERLFAANEIAQSFLPPPEWSETSTTGPASAAPDPTSSQARVLSTGRPYPSQHDFVVRIKELRCANEDAYHALTRTPQNGQPPIRLAHYRRFWEALSQAASYWDTSCDEYFPERSPENAVEESIKRDNGTAGEGNVTPGADEPRKRAKTNPDSEGSANELKLPLGSPPPAALDAKPSTVRPSLSVRPPKMPDQPDKPPGTYRGFRISNGSSMPDSYRIDAARAFIEPLAWAFGFTFAGHRRPPVLEIKSLLVPIKLSGTIWRPPNQRDKARAGYLQGPVLGISCRSETEFAEGKSNSTLDTLRELGALLCLAQERAREGITERKPGEGQWWTTVPRWGGGPGGEMGEAFCGNGDDKKDEIELAMEEMSRDPEARGRAVTRSSGAKRRQALANAWKTLRVSVGFWDPRTEYCAVGKAANSDWDEVYLISSLNHHMSVVKLRVHKHYLAYLRTGEWPTEDVHSEWSTPVMSRTRWYDLFDPDSRCELFRIIWGIMAYLARPDR